MEGDEVEGWLAVRRYLGSGLRSFGQILVVVQFRYA